MCTTSYSFFLSFFLPCSSCSPYHVCFSFSFRESAVWSWFRARCRWQKTEGQGRGPWNRVRLNKGCAHVLARGRGRRRVSGCDDGACVFFFFCFFFASWSSWSWSRGGAPPSVGLSSIVSDADRRGLDRASAALAWVQGRAGWLAGAGGILHARSRSLQQSGRR